MALVVSPDYGMHRGLSLYLDFVRFTAALFVFFFHAKDDKYNAAWLEPVGHYGNDAVMIFFVLSGFVIAFVASGKEDRLDDYMVSRFARLYSVIVPALVLTMVADTIGLRFDPTIYADGDYKGDSPFYRLFMNLFFLNEIWFITVQPFSNSPFWSMGYEFWYYVIFATLYYLSGWQRIFFTVLAMAIVGPKILLLFPIWLVGVLLYHAGSRVRLNTALAWCLALLPLVAYVLYRTLDGHIFLGRLTFSLLGTEGLRGLMYSTNFMNHYVVGGLFTVHLFGMMTLSKGLSLPDWSSRPIRYLAGMTFSLYLFHHPLLMMYASLTKSGVMVVALTFVTIMVLAPFTEGRKRQWKALIERIVAPFRKASGAAKV